MTIQEYVERGRKAVEAIKDYDQAQTDKLVYEDMNGINYRKLEIDTVLPSTSVQEAKTLICENQIDILMTCLLYTSRCV